MAIYTVHIPTGLSDPKTRAERTAFVRDGFSVAAFLFGPLYLLGHRAYAAAAAWVAAVAAIALVNHLLRLPLPFEIALALLIMLFTGLEASSVRRFMLHRRGLNVEGLVSAGGLEAGEAAFFRVVQGAEGPAAAGSARPIHATPTGVIGLFPDARG